MLERKGPILSCPWLGTLLCFVFIWSWAQLSWYKIITLLMQSSGEELDSKVSEWQWFVEMSEAGSRCALLDSPSLLYHYLDVLLHSVSTSWPYAAPSQCILKKGEGATICSVLLLTELHRILTELSCQQSPSRKRQGVQVKIWKLKTDGVQISPSNKILEEPGFWDSWESMGKINVCQICMQLCSSRVCKRTCS